MAECPGSNTLCVDLSDWNAAQTVVQSILPIDLLVNNAAVMKLSPFIEASERDFDSTVAINVKGVLAVSQVVAQDMIVRKCPGRIVNRADGQ